MSGVHPTDTEGSGPHTGVSESSSGNAFARALFGGIAAGYDRRARWLSLGQMPRWHRALAAVARASPGAHVLDVCTGTGSVAIELHRRYGCEVVGVDLSPEMLAAAGQRLRRLGLERSISLVHGRAETLPFPDGFFDAVVFTFLLRYVDDPLATIAELARVLKPGGTLASLEFGLPQSALSRAGWSAYAEGLLPVVTWPMGSAWRRVGGFLGGSIREFYRRYSLNDLEHMWTRAGIEQVQQRNLTFGSAVVMWGTKG